MSKTKRYQIAIVNVFEKLHNWILKKNRNMWFAIKYFGMLNSLLVNAPAFVYLLRVSWRQPLLGSLIGFHFLYCTCSPQSGWNSYTGLHEKTKGSGKIERQGKTSTICLNETLFWWIFLGNSQTSFILRLVCCEQLKRNQRYWKLKIFYNYKWSTYYG